MKLVFGESIGPDEGSITSKRISDKQLELTLVDGHKWAEYGGPLFLSKISFGETEVWHTLRWMHGR